MASPVLRLERVVKDYGEEVVTRAVDGVDFAVQAGEFAALIGPSGSGKSTLLNLIGLLDRPTGGTISLDGTETSSLDDGALTAYRGKKLGFIFQFHHLLPELSALENVMVPLWAAGMPRGGELERRAGAMLEAVGLAQKAHARGNQLSGGQQQRVAIARALVAAPRLVLADEPTGNLDTKSADAIFELMRRFNRERGTTFLIVTHDPRLAQRADRVIELVDGKVRYDGPVGGHGG